MRRSHQAAVALLCLSVAACGGEDVPTAPGASADASAKAATPAAGQVSVDAAGGLDGTPSADTATSQPGPVSFHPVGRWIWHDFPNDAAEGVAAGCGLVGSKQGSGLSLIETFASGGDFSALLLPDESGNISLTLLVHTLGWDGSSGLPASLHLQFLYGDQEADGVTDRFVVSSSTFPNRDPELPSQIFFPNTPIQPNGRFETARTDVPITFSMESDTDLTIVVSAGIVRGRLGSHPPGLRVDDGMLTGYFTETTIRTMVVGLQQSCNVPEPASFCATLTTILDASRPVADSAALLAQLFGGFDSYVDGDDVRTCSGSDCNAVSVCWLFRAEGTTVTGVR